MDPRCNPKGPYEREVSRSKEEVGNMTMDAGVGVMCERGHQPRNSGSLQKLEKTRKQILPWSLQEEPTLLTPWL